MTVLGGGGAFPYERGTPVLKWGALVQGYLAHKKTPLHAGVPHSHIFVLDKASRLRIHSSVILLNDVLNLKL